MMDPYLLGKIAYREGLPRQANPYSNKDAEWVIWMAGWRDGLISEMDQKKVA